MRVRCPSLMAAFNGVSKLLFGVVDVGGLLEATQDLSLRVTKANIAENLSYFSISFEESPLPPVINGAQYISAANQACSPVINLNVTLN